MTPERWQQVKALCQDALEHELHDRGAFIAEHCPDDPELRQEVEALLLQATNSDGILDAPVWEQLGIGMAEGAADARGPSVPWLPETIGRYRVLRMVGEGGMGCVYEAEQDHPRRAVALKVIKPGLASPELLRRFERESQALGRLQHPGIAQIYEAGAADTGYGPQPYFAMEFILGKTLKEYVAVHQLQTRQRLELVARICDAVQHAHERGLIHRDLKPGNILVDATGQPKILDFGVARLTSEHAHATRHTDLGQLVGTLAYMSPEQVLADPSELDTRSDVYALGVILYELLAGRLPYTIANRLHEAVQTIREEDPGRLSSVNRSYRGDIETIVAKALEKDKARRYASAAALAEDIRRYLADQPITARSASTTYQLQKLARRHKALVGGMTAVFVVLVAGVVTSTWQARRATAAQRLAVEAEGRASQERDDATTERNRALAAQAQAQQERNQAIAEKQRADTEAAIARAVSDFLRSDVLAQASAKAQSRPGTTPDPDLKVRTALDRAAARIGANFRDQPLVEASIRQTIGTSYQDLGLYPQARQQLERAFDLRKNALGESEPATLEILGNLAGSYTLEGKYQQAEPLYLKVVDGLRRARGDEDPDALRAMSDLAMLYQYQGRYAQAETLTLKVLETERRVLGREHPTTLVTADNLAFIYQLTGKYANAESLYLTVLDAETRVLGAEHPDTLATIGDLAYTYMLDGRHADAEPLYLKAVAGEKRVLGAEHPQTLATSGDLAILYRNQGKYREAESLYTEILAVRRRVLGEEHPETLSTLNNLGGLYSIQNRLPEAERFFTQGLESATRVFGAEHPNTLTFMNNIAQLYFRQGKTADAERMLSQVLSIRRRVLGVEHPDTLFAMNSLGVVYSRQGKLKEAELLFAQVLEIQRRTLGEEHPEALRAADNLGTAYFRDGDLEKAQVLFTKTFDSRRRILGEENPDTLRTASNLAVLYGELGRIDQAEALLTATLGTDHRVLGDNNPETLSAMERLAEIYRRQGQYERAQALLTDALAVRRRILGPRHPDTAQTLSMLGLVCLEQQKYAEVESLLGDLMSRAKETTDTWYRYQGESILGAALTAEKKYAEAEKPLVDGYEGMAERTAAIPADSRSAVVRAGEWVVQLYRAWGKPERAGEWSERLSAGR